MKATPRQISGGSPIPGNGSAVFRVQALDSGGQTLPDPSFHWYAIPQTGYATVGLNRRDTTEGLLTNSVRRPDGTFAPSPGQCLVEVRTIYRGIELRGLSAPVVLDP